MNTPARSIIVTIGDELLLGRTVDSNAAWLADRLTVLGLSVARIETIGDDTERIRDAVSRARSDSALVVTTGGLGPTDDDRTLDAVTAALDGRTPDLEVDNPRGVEAARWFAPEGEYGAVLVLPGPPREMTALFPKTETAIRRALEDRLGSVHTRTIATTGIPESRLAPRVQPLIDDLDGVAVAFLPDLQGVDLRLTVRDRPDGDAQTLLDSAEQSISEVVRPYRVSAPSGDVVEALTEALVDRGWTVAVAESCTGGGIGERLTRRPGASRAFLGGIIAYSNAIKRDLLGVPEDLITEHGAVSEPVAKAMAEGVCAAVGADCGIGISGIAGPDGGSPGKPVGTVCFSATTPDGASVATQGFRGDRDAVRRRSAQAAMVQLLRRVEGGS